MLKKNNCYETTVTGMSSDGNGVARIENMAVFIPNTAVGDHLNVKIVKVLKRYAFGIIDSMITKSDDRIEVDCSCYNACGGCAFRHISYKAELMIKQDIVVQALKRISGLDIDCQNIIGSEQVDRYRNKAQYPVACMNDEIACGFFAKRSHRVVNADDCNLQSIEFKEIKNEIVNFIKENKLSVYDEHTNEGEIRHIYLRKAVETDETMVCIVVKKALAKSGELVKLLTEKFPQISSIVVNKNPHNTNVILGEQCKTIYGKDYITDIICGIKVMISPLAFYQVNKPQAEVLYNKAIELAELSVSDTLIDLYCGTGTIGLVASKKVGQVIGVEIIPEAIENAKANAKLNGIENIRFICDDAAGATKALLAEGISPNVVIVDPPRKGIDESVVLDIAKMAPDRVVMVSCNPATAARDVKLFSEHGYIAKTAIPVDMFPRTTHVECVVLMSRQKA